MRTVTAMCGGRTIVVIGYGGAISMMGFAVLCFDRRLPHHPEAR